MWWMWSALQIRNSKLQDSHSYCVSYYSNLQMRVIQNVYNSYIQPPRIKWAMWLLVIALCFWSLEIPDSGSVNWLPNRFPASGTPPLYLLQATKACASPIQLAWILRGRTLAPRCLSCAGELKDYSKIYYACEWSTSSWKRLTVFAFSAKHIIVILLSTSPVQVSQLRSWLNCISFEIHFHITFTLRSSKIPIKHLGFNNITQAIC